MCADNGLPEKCRYLWHCCSSKHWLNVYKATNWAAARHAPCHSRQPAAGTFTQLQTVQWGILNKTHRHWNWSYLHQRRFPCKEHARLRREKHHIVELCSPMDAGAATRRKLPVCDIGGREMWNYLRAHKLFLSSSLTRDPEQLISAEPRRKTKKF